MHTVEDVTQHISGSFFVYSAQEDQKILFANAALWDIFKCGSFDEFMDHVGGSFHSLVYPKDIEHAEESIARQRAANNDNQIELTYRIVRKDGQIRWVDAFAECVHTENAGDIFRVSLYDITEKKLAEDAVVLCEKQLIVAKNTLLYNLLQSIHSPMNALLEYTEQARKSLDNIETEKSQLEKIATAGKLLVALCNELKDISEFDTYCVYPQAKKNDVETLDQEVTATPYQDIETKGIAITVTNDDNDTTVFLDTPHFQCALTHILSMVIQSPSSVDKIAFSVQQKSASELCHVVFELLVSDKDCDTSNPFKEARNPFSKEKGILGNLSVTKRILDFLGGTIVVRNEGDKQTNCILSLPLKVIEGSLQTIPVQNFQNMTAVRHILLAEDVELSRMLTEAVLQESGFEVTAVQDGKEAVEAVANSPEGYFSAVLMDIQMPVMNGYEATRAIRSLDRKDVFSLPIIALTANAKMNDKLQTFGSGMNEHLAKPFDAHGLVQTLKKYLPNK